MATEIWPAAQRVAADRFTPDQVSRLHPVLQLIRRQARRTRRLLVHPR
jgi:hypothetical protein